jgi:hypothetical protein
MEPSVAESSRRQLEQNQEIPPKTDRPTAVLLYLLLSSPFGATLLLDPGTGLAALASRRHFSSMEMNVPAIANIATNTETTTITIPFALRRLEYLPFAPLP